MPKNTIYVIIILQEYIAKGNDNVNIVTLVENTAENPPLAAEHGLGIYIETDRHRLLMDAGQTDALIRNSRLLGIDLCTVDTVILSHGHYDHSGGILPFSEINPRADIYMQSAAAEPHFNGEKYIGIDKDILSLHRLKLIEGNHRIDEELFLFSGIKGRRCYPKGNLKLSHISDGKRVCDNFAHEQCLVISCGGKSILLSGCAHNGILNILDSYREIFGGSPDYVISGFHLMKKDGEYAPEEAEIITETARELSEMNTVFFTGHCTGIPAFEIMKEIMGDKLHALHTGKRIVL